MVADRTTEPMKFPQELLCPIDRWTKQDVQKWIDYCIEEYSLGDVNRNEFQMNGKALLLLNETSFRQRVIRSGDILYKALQQHQTMIKSLNCQVFPSHLWSNFPFQYPPMTRSFNPPLLPLPSAAISTFHSHPSMSYLQSTLNHRPSLLVPPHFPDSIDSLTSMVKETQKSSLLPATIPCCSRTSSSSVKSRERSADDPPSTLNDLFIDSSPTIREEREEEQPNDVTNTNVKNECSEEHREIRYFPDRVNFRGDILHKPAGAKNCRILWEFLYILLEDSQYRSIIQWENREKMIFRIIQAEKLAALWGLQKNRISMTYEKLSRGMRYYYSTNIISKEQSKRLLYRFMRSPDEIRQSMKRPTGSPSLFYSALNRTAISKTSPELQTEEFLQPSSCFYPLRSKSDRSSCSSPDSFDSFQERLTDNEKHSFTSVAATKRKQAVPVSLKARLLQSLFSDQPLNLAVEKAEEENETNLKKCKNTLEP